MVMDAATYTGLLKDPAALHNVSLQDLKVLADRYPYAVGVQQLLLKKYQLKDESTYLAHLPLVALMSPDRKKLHAWVQQQLPVAQAEPAADLHHQVEEVLDEVVEEPTAQELETTRDILHIDEPVEEIEPIEVTPVLEVEEEPEEEAVEDALIQVPEEEVQQTEDEDNEAEELIDNYEQQMAPTGMPIIPVPMQDLAEIAKSIDKGADEEELAEVTEAEEIQDAEQPKSFSDWLKVMKGDTVVKPEPTKAPEPKEEEDELDEIIRTGSYEAELMMAAKQAEQVEQSKPASLADEDPMDDDEVAIDLKAKDSVKEHDENITETLAKIYELQKKYSKALDAYEKLMVKHPEKADYFRERIKLIENK